MDVPRLLIALGLTIGVLLAGAATALACNEPRISLDKKEAAAGENVPFTIVNVDEGADYTVTITGVRVGGGTAAGTAVRGSFTMPDFGSRAKAVSVEALVQHGHGADSGTWRSTATMRYVVPPPAAQNQPAAGQPAAAPAPDRPAEGAAATSEPEPASRPSAAPAAARTPPAAARSPRGTTTRAGDRTSAAARARPTRTEATANERTGRARALTTRSHRGAGEGARAGRPSAVKLTAPASRPRADLAAGAPLRGEAAARTSRGAVPSASVAAPTAIQWVRAPAGLAAAPVPATPARSEPSPILIVVGVALLGVALVVLEKRRRREHGDESDAPAPRLATGESRFATPDVEAALQELIAEHRAQELLDTDTAGMKLGRID